MKRALPLVLGLGMAFAPMGVGAQIYNGSPPALAQFDFVSAAGSVAGTFGVYVGPYTGNFVGDGVGNFSIYCVDYLHYASQSDGWANVSQLSTIVSDAATNTRLEKNLAAADALAKYRKSAYLASLFDSWESHNGGGTYTKAQVFSGLHAAIWDISSGVTLGSGNTANRRTYFLGLAGVETNLATVDLREWYVITRTAAIDGYAQSGDGYGQEFLMRRTSVPEPSTLLLMATGFFLLVGVSRRRIFLVEDL